MVMNGCYALCAVMSLIAGSYFPFEEKSNPVSPLSPPWFGRSLLPFIIRS